MKSDPTSRAGEEELRRYLLGDLSEPELADVEQRMFADEAFYEQLSLIEEDLIDDYVTGSLGPTERSRFEAVFLESPKRRARVEFAQKLRRSSASLPAPSVVAAPAGPWWAAFLDSFSSWKTPIWAAVAVTALVAVAVTGTLFVARSFWRSSSLPKAAEARSPARADPRVAQLREQLERSEAERRKLEQRIGQRPLSIASNAPLAFVLSPGLLRDESSPTQLRVPAGEGEVQLTLDLEVPLAGPYRAILQTRDGVEVWTENLVNTPHPTKQSSVVLHVPGRVLTPGDYRLQLSRESDSGAEEVASEYVFRVRRQ